MKIHSLFVDHGNPMNAIQTTPYTDRLREIGKLWDWSSSLNGIIIASAHWMTPAGEIAVLSTPQPKMIYDMYGFPDPLYHMTYSAPSDPVRAGEIADLLGDSLWNQEVSLTSEWGYDHGIWSILVHLAPRATLPVIPVSLPYTHDYMVHAEIGRILAEYARKNGYLLIWSGNIVHNLSRLDWTGKTIYPWAKSFDTAVESLVTQGNPLELITPEKLEGARESVPTPDHYAPFAGFIGSLEGSHALSLSSGFELGSISTRVYVRNEEEQKFAI